MFVLRDDVDAGDESTDVSEHDSSEVSVDERIFLSAYDRDMVSCVTGM